MPFELKHEYKYKNSDSYTYIRTNKLTNRQTTKAVFEQQDLLTNDKHWQHRPLSSDSSVSRSLTTGAADIKMFPQFCQQTSTLAKASKHFYTTQRTSIDL